MPENNIDVRVRLRDARRFQADARASGRAVQGIGDTSSRAGRSLRQSGDDATKTGRAYRAMGAGARIGGLALGAGLVFGIRKSIVEFREAGKVGRETDAVLRSTGGAANVTAGQVGSLAERISNKTGIDDEQIQSGQNMLLTFKGIRNEVGAGNDIFNQASSIMTDMSSKFGVDASKSAVQLGKALNDPVKGITALTRVGVTFTEQEKNRIKTLTESGRKTEAQKIILRELNTEFGGVAAAKADPFDRLRKSTDNLFESIGRLLVPSLAVGAGKLSTFIDQMQRGAGPGGEFRNTLHGIWTTGKPVLSVIGGTATALYRFGQAHPNLAKVAGAIVGIGVALKVISFASSITGVSRLLGLTSRLARTQAGAQAVAGLLTPFTYLPGRLGARITAARGRMVSTMATNGRLAGAAGATGMATTMSATTPGALARSGVRGKFLTFFRGLGVVAGGAMAAKIAFELNKELSNWLESKLPGGVDLSGPGGTVDIAKPGGADLSEGKPPSKNPNQGYVPGTRSESPRGLRIMEPAGLVDSTPAGSFTAPSSPSRVARRAPAAPSVMPLGADRIARAVPTPTVIARVYLHGREIAQAVAENTADQAARR